MERLPAVVTDHGAKNTTVRSVQSGLVHTQFTRHCFTLNNNLRSLSAKDESFLNAVIEETNIYP